ncbi:alternative ribosome rescue aminoacyl-tRNA hydrolase ArfB [Actinocatenispora sera]|jgi:ribosome-associated protein|uniref:Aminoacyl-tRNA hydrolase n=1 Tax=Actinocatenispora sera TaxID=390989 RepID=A0A810L7P2_9ACTN|nr:alternative ribosome rescue aminoacyl-tRNA hydrolase ArfB [Actinocatenispora sera]BCJ31257.1 aminoacyl-tRNA hydrolase [Actinocatenispora sera]
MPEPLTVTRSISIPGVELRWRFSRSGGPGGQGVNTADSRVELSWDLVNSPVLSPTLRDRAVERLGSRLVDGVLTVAASEHRAQLDNRRAAAQRLAELVRRAIAPPPPTRRATKPSRGAVTRRLNAKRRRGDIKKLRRDTSD